MEQLNQAAHVTGILPSLSDNSLVSIKVFADNEYTTIFHPYKEGVALHDSEGIRISEKKLCSKGGKKKMSLESPTSQQNQHHQTKYSSN